MEVRLWTFWETLRRDSWTLGKGLRRDMEVRLWTYWETLDILGDTATVIEDEGSRGHL